MQGFFSLEAFSLEHKLARGVTTVTSSAKVDRFCPGNEYIRCLMIRCLIPSSASMGRGIEGLENLPGLQEATYEFANGPVRQDPSV